MKAIKKSIKSLIDRYIKGKIEIDYEIIDTDGNCACKKCNPSLNKIYLEKNEILRVSKIICVAKTRIFRG